MNFRRTIAKTMIFAMALGMFSFTSPNSAKAEITAPNGYAFSGEAETIKAGSAKFWSIVKVLKDDKKADMTVDNVHLQVGTIEPIIGTHIDVSSLNKNKELNIIVGTVETLEPAGWKLIKIPAQAKDFTAHYLSVADEKEANEKGAPNGGYLLFKKNKESVTDLLSATNKYQVKIGNGSWAKVEEYFKATQFDEASIGAKLENLAQLGASLSFREAGTASAWASKESKVKISSKAKGPSVKIDPVKGTVSVKKGMEFVVPESGTGTPAESESFSKVEKEKNLLADVGLHSLDKTKHLLVRTGATNKKLASKITDITVNYQAAPAGGNAATAEGGAILTDVTVATKVPYDISKGATITNNTDKEYEFYISPKGTAIDNPKWTKLKAKTMKKGQAVPTVVALKYSKDAKDYTYGPTNENTKLFIRLAGKKQVDNEVTLPSAPAQIALKLAKAAQTVTVSENGVSGAYPTSSATIATAKPGTTYKFNVKVVKMYSKKAPSLKTKVTKKANGVSVKGGKFVPASTDQSGTASLEFKLSKDIFKKAESAVTEVEYSVEGVKGKLTVTFNK